MYHGSKSDLLKKFERFTVDSCEYVNRKSAVVIDMAHLIHGKAFADLDTFADFAFALYFQVKSIGQSFERWDLCFDRCNSDSLKTADTTSLMTHHCQRKCRRRFFLTVKIRIS